MARCYTPGMLRQIAEDTFEERNQAGRMTMQMCEPYIRIDDTNVDLVIPVYEETEDGDRTLTGEILRRLR